MKDSLLNKRFKYTYSNACLWLALVNLAVYFATDYLGLYVKGIPIKYWLCMNPLMVRSGYVWQVFTYMFCHGNFTHLFFNMLGLMMFGSIVERTLGTREFLLFYFVSGTLAGIASFALYAATGQWLTFLLGASGAIYAIEFLVAVLAPHMQVLMFWFLPMKMPMAVIFYAVIEFFSQFVGGDGVAHAAHLFGILAAWLYCLVRFRVHPIRIWRDALGNPRT